MYRFRSRIGPLIVILLFWLLSLPLMVETTRIRMRAGGLRQCYLFDSDRAPVATLCRPLDDGYPCRLADIAPFLVASMFASKLY